MRCPRAHALAHRRKIPPRPAVALFLLSSLLCVADAVTQTRQRQVAAQVERPVWSVSDTDGVAERGDAARDVRDDAVVHHGGGVVAAAVAYSVPTPRVEALSPRGVRASIPDEAGISQVRFHLGVNKPLSAQRLGTVNVEVSQPTGPVWTYEDRTTVLDRRDVVYYWLQVTRAGHTYERAGTHTVLDFEEVYDVGGTPSSVGLLGVPLAGSLTSQTPSRRPTQGAPEHQQQQSCARSLTSVNGRLVCQGELLFQENFDNLDFSSGPWKHDVRIASQPDFEFAAFTQSTANTYAVNGQLVIRPTLMDDVYGKDFVRSGTLRLDNCTAGPLDSQLCSRQARYGYILPPILSGRISTRKSFSFRYGTIEIRAKLPSGDWIYPELWLLPREEAYGPGLKSGRIQLALTRGNAELHLGATELGLRRLESAAIASPGTSASPAYPEGLDQGLDQDDEDGNGVALASPAVAPPVPSALSGTWKKSTLPAAPAASTTARTTSTSTPRTTSTSTSRTTPTSPPKSGGSVTTPSSKTTTRPSSTTKASATGSTKSSRVTTRVQIGTSSSPKRTTVEVRAGAGTTTRVVVRTGSSSATRNGVVGQNQSGPDRRNAEVSAGNGPTKSNVGVQTGSVPTKSSVLARTGSGSSTASPSSANGSTGSSSSSSGTRAHSPSSSRSSPPPPFVTPSAGDSVSWLDVTPPSSSSAGEAWFRRRTARSISSLQAAAGAAGYRGPLRKEVSRTELPGRPWSGGFHNYTLQWTPDAMVFSVDGVELGVLVPEPEGGLIRSARASEDDPWHQGSKMAPFDREFYISLGLAVGGIHTFPEGVQGPHGIKKPWKNTAAKAMLSFWNAKETWLRSWSTDSALLVDSVRVTAL